MSADLFAVLCLLPAAYLLGAVPVGLILARWKGIDLQRVGSGNIGATNVFRSVGKWWGVATFALDALKGFVPAFYFPMILPNAPPWFGIACGVAAIAGHNWPVWLRFRGGKGVSTSAGMLIGIAPAAAGIGFLAFAIVVAISRYVSLASIVAAIAVPAAGWFLYAKTNSTLAITLIVMGLLVIWRHRANIVRLMTHTEPKIRAGKKR